MSRLATNVALITGAGSGFGRAMSIAFCKAGAQVVGVGRREQKLAETARLAGPGFHPLKWDVTEARFAHDLVREVVAKAGGLHILVNNAAVMLGSEKSLTEYPLGDFEATMKTNVTALFALTQAAFVHMKLKRYGRVLNVSSGLGFRPMLPYGVYCVSKAAVNMLTRVFALEAEGHGILVNAIDPGVAKTEMNPTATSSAETINDVALHLASLPKTGPNGACFNKKLQSLDW